MRNSQRIEIESTSITSSEDLTETSAIEDRDIRSRRKILEKAEKKLDTIADPKVAMNNPRNRMWLRTTAFLLFLGCVILFFVPEERLNFRNFPEQDRKFHIN